MPWEFVTERHLSAQNWKSFLFLPPVKILAWQASSPPLRVIHCPIHQKGEQPLSPQGDQHSPSHCCRPRQTCRSDAARFGTLYFSFLEIFQFLPFQQQKCNPPWSLVWKECRRPRARSPWKESCRMRFVFHNPLFYHEVRKLFCLPCRVSRCTILWSSRRRWGSVASQPGRWWCRWDPDRWQRCCNNVENLSLTTSFSPLIQKLMGARGEVRGKEDSVVLLLKNMVRTETSDGKVVQCPTFSCVRLVLTRSMKSSMMKSNKSVESMERWRMLSSTRYFRHLPLEENGILINIFIIDVLWTSYRTKKAWK